MDMIAYMLGKKTGGGTLKGKTIVIPDVYFGDITPVCIDDDSGEEIYIAASGQKFWIEFPELEAYGTLKIKDIVSNSVLYENRVQQGQSSSFTVDGAPRDNDGKPVISSGAVILISVSVNG